MSRVRITEALSWFSYPYLSDVVPRPESSTRWESGSSSFAWDQMKREHKRLRPFIWQVTWIVDLDLDHSLYQYW